MALSDLISYLIIGSYIFGALSWAFLYREIKALRGEVEQLRIALAFERGKQEGADHESRLTRLERAHP